MSLVTSQSSGRDRENGPVSFKGLLEAKRARRGSARSAEKEVRSPNGIPCL